MPYRTEDWHITIHDRLLVIPDRNPHTQQDHTPPHQRPNYWGHQPWHTAGWRDPARTWPAGSRDPQATPNQEGSRSGLRYYTTTTTPTTTSLWHTAKKAANKIMHALYGHTSNPARSSQDMRPAQAPPPQTRAIPITIRLQRNKHLEIRKQVKQPTERPLTNPTNPTGRHLRPQSTSQPANCTPTGNSKTESNPHQPKSPIPPATTKTTS